MDGEVWRCPTPASPKCQTSDAPKRSETGRSGHARPHGCPPVGLHRNIPDVRDIVCIDAFLTSTRIPAMLRAQAVDFLRLPTRHESKARDV
jgi:hypothetical protein